jgi:hypothetical protein
MIMIGSSGQNAGKTTIAKELIKEFKTRFKVAVLKITCVSHRGAHCPHESGGCGICSNLQADYELVEELDRGMNKDTSELLAAGADRVFWLRSLYESLKDGYADFCSQISPEMLVLCESNSLRKNVKPGCFIMVLNSKHKTLKPTAQDVLDLADITFPVNEPEHPDIAGLISRLHVQTNNSVLTVSL